MPFSYHELPEYGGPSNRFLITLRRRDGRPYGVASYDFRARVERFYSHLVNDLRIDPERVEVWEKVSILRKPA